MVFKRVIWIIIIAKVLQIVLCQTEKNEKGMSQVERLKRSGLYFYSPYLRNEIHIETSMVAPPQHFNGSQPLKVLIHGWMCDRNHITIEPIKNAYLSRQETNLLIVDWELGARQNYDLSRKLVPLVAKRMGKVLKFFFGLTNVRSTDVHLIGHSLGAHIAGNIGKYFKGQIGRITALDPAGPLFLKSSPDACSSKDAFFVDAIHTDVGVLGEKNPRGHVDFYPNRGFPPQPGCYMIDLISASSCSHYRAPLLFAESILLPRQFLAVQCDTQELFNSIKYCRYKTNMQQLSVQGQSRPMVFMGENISHNATGTFYLETNNSPPYGKGLNLYI